MKNIEQYKSEIIEASKISDFDTFFALFKQLISEHGQSDKLLIEDLEEPFVKGIKELNLEPDSLNLLDFIIKNLDRNADVFSKHIFEFNIGILKTLFDDKELEGLLNSIENCVLLNQYEHLIFDFSDDILPILEAVIKFSPKAFFYDWLLKIYHHKLDYNEYKDRLLLIKKDIPKDATIAWNYIAKIHIKEHEFGNAFLSLKNVKIEIDSTNNTYDIISPRPLNKIIIKEYFSLRKAY